MTIQELRTEKILEGEIQLLIAFNTDVPITDVIDVTRMSGMMYERDTYEVSIEAAL